MSSCYYAIEEAKASTTWCSRLGLLRAEAGCNAWEHAQTAGSRPQHGDERPARLPRAAQVREWEECLTVLGGWDDADADAMDVQV